MPLSLRERIESDIQRGRFKDGYSNEQALRYGVGIAAVIKALQVIAAAEAPETPGGGVLCRQDTEAGRSRGQSPSGGQATRYHWVTM